MHPCNIMIEARHLQNPSGLDNNANSATNLLKVDSATGNPGRRVRPFAVHRCAEKAPSVLWKCSVAVLVKSNKATLSRLQDIHITKSTLNVNPETGSAALGTLHVCKAAARSEASERVFVWARHASAVWRLDTYPTVLDYLNLNFIN